MKNQTNPTRSLPSWSPHLHFSPPRFWLFAVMPSIRGSIYAGGTQAGRCRCSGKRRRPTTSFLTKMMVRWSTIRSGTSAPSVFNPRSSVPSRCASIKAAKVLLKEQSALFAWTSFRKMRLFDFCRSAAMLFMFHVLIRGLDRTPIAPCAVRRSLKAQSSHRRRSQIWKIPVKAKKPRWEIHRGVADPVEKQSMKFVS